MNNLRKIYASVWSAIVSVVFTAAVTIFSELSPQFMSWLKALTGHHWKSKSILSLVVFVLCFFVLYAMKRNVNEHAVARAIWSLVAIALAGAVAITWFFVWFYLLGE